MACVIVDEGAHMPPPDPMAHCRAPCLDRCRNRIHALDVTFETRSSGPGSKALYAMRLVAAIGVIRQERPGRAAHAFPDQRRRPGAQSRTVSVSTKLGRGEIVVTLSTRIVTSDVDGFHAAMAQPSAPESRKLPCIWDPNARAPDGSYHLPWPIAFAIIRLAGHALSGQDDVEVGPAPMAAT